MRLASFGALVAKKKNGHYYNATRILLKKISLWGVCNSAVYDNATSRSMHLHIYFFDFIYLCNISFLLN